jgi:hypothetical protein
MSDGFKKGAKTVVQFTVAAVAFLFGFRILSIAVRLIDSGSVSDKWPIVGVLAIGAFLLVGSQYKKLKAGPEGIEGERYAELFARVNQLAAQHDLTVRGLAANRAQVVEMGRALSENNSIAPETRRQIETIGYGFAPALGATEEAKR